MSPGGQNQFGGFFSAFNKKLHLDGGANNAESIDKNNNNNGQFGRLGSNFGGLAGQQS